MQKSSTRLTFKFYFLFLLLFTIFTFIKSNTFDSENIGVVICRKISFSCIFNKKKCNNSCKYYIKFVENAIFHLPYFCWLLWKIFWNLMSILLLLRIKKIQLHNIWSFLLLIYVLQYTAIYILVPLILYPNTSVSVWHKRVPQFQPGNPISVAAFASSIFDLSLTTCKLYIPLIVRYYLPSVSLHHQIISLCDCIFILVWFVSVAIQYLCVCVYRDAARPDARSS